MKFRDYKPEDLIGYKCEISLIRDNTKELQLLKLEDLMEAKLNPTEGAHISMRWASVINGDYYIITFERSNTKMYKVGLVGKEYRTKASYQIYSSLDLTQRYAPGQSFEPQAVVLDGDSIYFTMRDTLQKQGVRFLRFKNEKVEQLWPAIEPNGLDQEKEAPAAKKP